MLKKPKYKVCRRLGPGVYDKCQTEKYALAVERKGPQRFKRRRRSSTNYGQQLLEKQKVRFTYGVTERQFRSYVQEALKAGNTNPVERLYELLESRLDNVIYRSGLAPTRRASRQLVVHGHILVNGKRMSIPSHRIYKGDVVEVREASKNKMVFEARLEQMKEHSQPSWLMFDLAAYKTDVSGVPQQEESSDTYDLNSVLEFYSR